MKQFLISISERSPLLILLFLFNVNYAYSQSDKHLSVGIGPFAYLDLITPSINFHVETKIYKLYRIDIAYGLDVSQFALSSEFHPNPEFTHHEFKLGLKRFFNQTDDAQNFVGYGAIEYFSVLNDYEKGSGRFINNGQHIRFSSAKVSRNISGLRLKYGIQKIRNSIGFDIYLGGGLRHVDIQYDDVTDGRFVSSTIGFEEWFTPIDRTAGSRLKLDLNIGFKIFYMIVK